MKILNIHFKNINSLEGESWINFEQSPFSDTGVFAITGPNGSGKSSILDVITLALYGETFRFDRPASHVMTKRTTESLAEIEFSLGDDSYRSSWHVQRVEGDPDGEPMLPEMQLIRLKDDNVLANTPQQVCARITEITGMNFRNFTRSIMLAQGDFSAFLNALDNERMDILEKIISTDIYADYKKDVIDKAENAQKELARIKQDLANIKLMDPEKLEASEHDLIDYNEQLSELQDEQTSLEQQHALFTQINDIKGQIVAQEKPLASARAKLGSTQKSLDRIAASQEALIFSDEITALKANSHAIRQGKADLEDFQNELKQLKSKLGNETAPEKLEQLSLAEQQQALENIRSQINQISFNRQSETEQWQSLAAQLANRKPELATISTWLEENSADAVLVTGFLDQIGQLKRLRNELEDISGKQKSFTRQSKKSLSLLKNNNSSLEKEKKKLLDLKKQLEEDEQQLETMAQGNKPEDIDNLKIEQQERIKDFQTLYNLAQNHQKLTGNTGFFSFFVRKDQPTLDLETLTLDLEKIRQDIKREENIKHVLGESIINESLLKRLASDRVHLVNGKPCPLCGALQHPYAKHPPAVPTSSRQAMIDQKAKIRLLKEKSIDIQQSIAMAQKQSEKAQAKQLQIQQTRAQWLNLCNRLNVVSHELDINKLSLMQKLIKKEVNELAEITRFIAKFRGKQSDIEKLKGLVAKCEGTIDQLQSSTQQLGFNTQDMSQEQLAIESAYTRCQQEEKLLAQKVLEQLVLLGEKMPAKGQEDALFDRLNLRRQDYHSHAYRHKSLTEELASLETKQAACQTEITRCNELLEVYSGRLETEETVSLHLALVEKQKLIANKEQSLAQLKIEAAGLNQSLQEKLLTSQFTSLQEIREILELMENQPELERQKAELEQEIDARAIELETLIARLEASSAQFETSSNITEIEEQLRRIAGKIEIASMEAQHLKRLISEQHQLQQTYDEEVLRLQQQEAAYHPYFAEAALLSEESGMAFRRRVQKQIADKLLSQTNAILEKISGRYYLRQAPSDQGLALEVEDTYQANVRRMPRTLSGGESFVISLSLALGLSELANNGRSVDSLFLDEGFGNLDADSLFTVISTLESLHTHGKTVGVISHVEAVQKRIKAQLQVVKKPNGMGELKKVS